MNEKALKVLEYYKIVGMLESRAQSSLGKNIVKTIKPSIKIEEIDFNQRETEEALNIIIKRGRFPLGGISDITSEIKRADIGATLSPKELVRVSGSLRAARILRNFMKHDKSDKESNYPIIEELIDSLMIYRDIEDEIDNAIISEEEIADDASPGLKTIRRQMKTKASSIKSKLNSIISSNKYQKFLQDPIITMRSDRYVVPIKQEYRSSFPGLVHDQSSSGATLFMEPMSVVNLNNELKELELKERDEIEKILMNLSAMVSTVVEDLKSNQINLGRIDFAAAKGSLALDMEAVKPELNTKGYINIKKGRHPLIDKKEVVPTDIWLGDKFTTLVVTGPNTGGKTVTLKTTGLLTLMAQSGLHVPASYGTHMAVFDNVFADIGDEQSIEQSLSTFSSHMTNIVTILDSFTENSLVLFDELGAGTDPDEGAALAMSILNYLYNHKVRTVATTHYSELKIYAITTEGIENASVEFDVNTLSPTYKLLIGVPGKSNAFEISKRLGISDHIINGAKEFLSKETIEFEDVLIQIDKDRKEAEEKLRVADSFKRDTEKLKNRLKQKEKKLENIKEKAIREAREEARDILREAKKEADTILKELREMSSESSKDRNKRMEEARRKLRNKMNSLDEELSEEIEVEEFEPPKNLKPGDTVEIVSLGQTGTVLSEPDNSGSVMVQAGIMKVKMKISNLKMAKEDNSQVTFKTQKMIKNKAKTVKLDIDLRGQNLEEAILEVDKYLDDAYMAGLPRVTIIHGKGTGVLREGIRQILKRHKHVKSFRVGEFGEGGDGVTVADIK